MMATSTLLQGPNDGQIKNVAGRNMEDEIAVLWKTELEMKLYRSGVCNQWLKSQRHRRKNEKLKSKE